MADKVHMRTDRRRLLGFGESTVIMLCGSGWGHGLPSTENASEVTCLQCLRRMRKSHDSGMEVE